MQQTLGAERQKTNNPDAQRGSIIIPTAGAILVGLILLGAVQFAYAFYMKRELQNAADLAALSGAQALYTTNHGADCGKATTAAQTILNRNLNKYTSSQDGNTVNCGVWNPQDQPDAPHFTALEDRHSNAVRVQVQHTLPSIVPFMSATTVRGDAIAATAATEPVAAFSVGPQLLGVNDGLLPAILSAAGLNAEYATVLDYNGLVNAKLTPAGLLRQLGLNVDQELSVADLRQLLQAEGKVSILASDLLSNSIEVASAGGWTGNAELGLLQSLIAETKIQDLELNLLNDPGGDHGLFSLSSLAEDPAGLNAEVGLANIIEIILSAATKENALKLDTPTLNIDSVLSLALHLGIVEPPSIGIGPRGTTAHSANIRALIRICLLNGCDSNNTHTFPLLGLIPFKLGLDVPIVLELVNGTGTLGNMCYADASGRRQAEIYVRPSLLDACIGRFDAHSPGDPNYAFSSASSCTQQISDNPEKFKHKLLELDLSPIFPKIGLTSSLAIPAVTAPLASADFYVKQTIHLPENGNNLALGTSLKGIKDGLLSLLVGTTLTSSNSMSTPGPQRRKDLAEQLWEGAKAEIGCDASNTSNVSCRRTIAEQVQNNLRESTEKVRTFSVVGLLTDILNSVLGLVDGVVSIITGNPCTGGGILNWFGSEQGCINVIADSSILTGTSQSGGVSLPNALVPLLGMALNVIEPLLRTPLDHLGSTILSPLLNDLGLKVGQVETTLISLDCEPAVRLVH